MSSGFAEQLIVPESNTSPQQLTRRHQKSGMPQEIMKPLPEPPRTKGMKQNSTGISGLVGMILVPSVAPLVIGLHQLRQLGFQQVNLELRQDLDPRQVTGFVKCGDLFVRQSIRVPIFGRLGRLKQGAKRGVFLTEVFGHIGFSPRD